MKKACKSGKRIQKFNEGGMVKKQRLGQVKGDGPTEPSGLKKTVYY